MSGIFLILVVMGWLVAVVALTWWVAARFKSLALQVISSLVLFPGLLALPLIDEIIGKRQFDALCERYAVQYIDEAHAMNRRVVYERRGADQYAEGTAIEIRIDPIVFRDAETNRVLVSYRTLHAKGGWLIRTLGISETNSPLLVPRGCAPKDQDAFKTKFNITVIN
jgi:hypothetical protein